MSRQIDPDKVIVRQAAPKDTEGIARIYNLHIDAGGATFDTQHWTGKRTSHYLAQSRPDGWFVAENRDGLIGWASVRQFSARFGFRFSCESAIYLDPVALGLGVADRLQDCVESHCHACEIHHVVAKILSNNKRSLAFHRRRGYEVVGVQREIGHMNGRWVDLTILQKIFA